MGPQCKTEGACLEATPVRLLIDTDIGPDCDDTGALAVAPAPRPPGGVDFVGLQQRTRFWVEHTGSGSAQDRERI